eukprot:CAMPEP_0185039320 /NCGR_PEP_ID=MMETSP1103-20130426/36064_1 /TAXON_ID=36769 /ORGANISM="Paraphysomonas bandaiensis, Strain Caron Lab Isolate" /LENGTH=132 /DNA_ID=CAMNT_0027578163 /DNA_START=779 /DNA_END=1177 /DNA_ORIENTATION=-
MVSTPDHHSWNNPPGICQLRIVLLQYCVVPQPCGEAIFPPDWPSERSQDTLILAPPLHSDYYHWYMPNAGGAPHLGPTSYNPKYIPANKYGGLWSPNHVRRSRATEVVHQEISSLSSLDMPPVALVSAPKLC